MYQYHLGPPLPKPRWPPCSWRSPSRRPTSERSNFNDLVSWFFFWKNWRVSFAKLIIGTQKILEFFFIWHEVTYGKCDYLHHIPICIRPFSLPERTLRGVSRVDFQFEGGCDVEMLGSDKTSHQKAWFWEIRTWTSSPSEKICHSINQNSLKLPLAPFCSAKTTHN